VYLVELAWSWASGIHRVCETWSWIIMQPDMTSLCYVETLFLQSKRRINLCLRRAVALSVHQIHRLNLLSSLTNLLPPPLPLPPLPPLFLSLHPTVHGGCCCVRSRACQGPVVPNNLSKVCHMAKRESGGIVLAVRCWARAPRGGVTPQGVVLTDLQSLLDCQ
jgi:hypothetical protein